MSCTTKYFHREPACLSAIFLQGRRFSGCFGGRDKMRPSSAMGLAMPVELDPRRRHSSTLQYCCAQHW